MTAAAMLWLLCIVQKSTEGESICLIELLPHEGSSIGGRKPVSDRTNWGREQTKMRKSQSVNLRCDVVFYCAKLKIAPDFEQIIFESAFYSDPFRPYCCNLLNNQTFLWNKSTFHMETLERVVN